MERKERLKKKMQEYQNQDICLAFSGGVDSSLLLKLACDTAMQNKKKVYAVTFDTKLHPACDLEIAKKVVEQIGGIHKIIKVDELEQEEMQNNPINRCYLCKYQLFQKLKKFAEKEGIEIVMDGTNADDLTVYRPGIQALKELGIKSPLAEAGITKKEVKQLAKEYHLSVADRPSAPCIATRLPYHTKLDYKTLEKIEKGEEYIREIIGGNVRLRLHQDIARIEIDVQRFSKFLEQKKSIVNTLKRYGFSYITLDLEGFRSGSMDIYIEKEKRQEK